jgi:hypothetical protein
VTDKDNLEHTEEGTTTRDDPLDLGVPMKPGREPKGPEDALDPNARGDYTGKLGGGESYTSELIPEEERVPGGPTVRMVRQK